jgi:hypothetical protein
MIVLLINVPPNVDQTQSILSHSPHDGVIIGVFFKQCLEYKSFYMSRNVHPNMVIITL